MALVGCSECKKRVSDQAEACPHCGHPLGSEPAARAPAATDTGVAARGAKTCPRCRKGVDPKAYKCPHCKKTLRTTPMAWGCLTVILFLVVVSIIMNLGSGDGGTSGPSEAPARASASQPMASAVEPIVEIRKYVGLTASELLAAFERDFGPEGTVERQQVQNSWVVFAKTAGARIEVFEENGRIASINVHFETPAPDCVTAMALVGLPTTDKPLPRDVPAFYGWTSAFEGISEVRAHRQPVGGSSIRAVGMIP